MKRYIVTATDDTEFTLDDSEMFNEEFRSVYWRIPARNISVRELPDISDEELGRISWDQYSIKTAGEAVRKALLNE